MSEKKAVIIGDENLEKALQETLGVPVTIEKLEKLEHFDNWNEYRTETKPVWKPIVDITPLQYCKNLETINGDGNGIEDLSPLGEINSLRELWFAGNKIADISPLKNKTNLEILVLDKNSDLKDISPIKGLPKLDYLNISNTGVTDLAILHTFPNLKKVSIYGLEDHVWKNRTNYQVVEELLREGVEVKMREVEEISADIIRGTPRLRDDMPLDQKLRALGAFKILRLIEEQGIDGQLEDNWEGMALSVMHLAVKHFESGEDPVRDRPRLVEILLAEKAPTDLVNSEGLPTLIYFLEDNPNVDLRILKGLIDHGFDVNEVVEGFKTPLYMAIHAVEESREAVDMLIENGADLKSPDILYAAVEKGLEDLVEKILKSGLDVNARESNYGRTAICNPMLNRKMLQRFIDAGINVHIRDNEGRTALFYAVEYSNLDVVELLLERGSDVNERDNDGNTPLHYMKESLTRRDDSLGIIPLLVKKGADVNALNKDGQSPLDRVRDPSIKKQLSAILN
jgi:ankyrin repeat protein